jgi:hypothetical protein
LNANLFFCSRFTHHCARPPDIIYAFIRATFPSFIAAAVNVYSLMASKLGTAFSPRSSELGKKVWVIGANVKVKDVIYEVQF